MREISAERKPLTAFHLKVIALTAMVIDHIGAIFPFAPPLNSLMRGVGRIAFPLYAFFVAEGCRYTRNREKYLLRLGLFALISELPFDRAFYPRALQLQGLGKNFLNVTNVFYTMFFAVACIHIWETLRRQSRKFQSAVAGGFAGSFAVLLLLCNTPWLLTLAAFAYLAILLLACHFWKGPADSGGPSDSQSDILPAVPLLPILLLADMVQCDYSGFGVLLIFLLYLAKNRKTQIAVLAAGMIFLYGLGSGLNLIHWVASGFSEPPTLHGTLAFAFSLLAVVLVYFYNGQRGREIKWAFYAAYPVHLAILATLRIYIGP